MPKSTNGNGHVSTVREASERMDAIDLRIDRVASEIHEDLRLLRTEFAASMEQTRNSFTELRDALSATRQTRWQLVWPAVSVAIFFTVTIVSLGMQGPLSRISRNEIDIDSIRLQTAQYNSDYQYRRGFIEGRIDTHSNEIRRLRDRIENGLSQIPKPPSMDFRQPAVK